MYCASCGKFKRTLVFPKHDPKFCQINCAMTRLYRMITECTPYVFCTTCGQLDMVAHRCVRISHDAVVANLLSGTQMSPKRFMVYTAEEKTFSFKISWQETGQRYYARVWREQQRRPDYELVGQIWPQDLAFQYCKQAFAPNAPEVVIFKELWYQLTHNLPYAGTLALRPEDPEHATIRSEPSKTTR